MAIYPKANVKLLSHNVTKSKTSKNAVILHSTASNASSQYSWFNNPKAYSSSHFHVAKDGTVEQYIDTNFVSSANLAANNRSVTIETAGVQSKDEPWTDEQVLALVKLISWIVKEHKISVRQMESSLASETGIGWHRLGCDGNFPNTGILRGRKQRVNGTGELWSKSFGKVCPGTLRIQQVPGIISSVKKETSIITAVKNVVKNTASKVSAKKSWPDVDLASTANLSTIKSTWSKVMKGLGISGSVDKAMQSWLSPNFYKGRIDGNFGAMSVKALQTFLKSKGLYSGKIDGSRGPVTLKAEIKYLNSQKKFF